MFGNVKACRHTLGPWRAEWMALLCGTCLAVRDRAGQLARVAVVTDAVALGALMSAVAGDPLGTRRAGPCLLRALRPATVGDAADPAVTLAVAATLLAAETKATDAAHDHDLPGGRGAARAAAAVAARLAPACDRVCRDAGVDVATVRSAAVASRDVERRGSADLHEWIEPVAVATAELFRPTGLDEVGRRVGRVTLLADAVADLEADRGAGRPNPLAATATSVGDARELIAADLAWVGTEVKRLVGEGLAAQVWGHGWSRGVARAAGLRQPVGAAIALSPVVLWAAGGVGEAPEEERARAHRGRKVKKAADDAGMWCCDCWPPCCIPFECCCECADGSS